LAKVGRKRIDEIEELEIGLDRLICRARRYQAATALAFAGTPHLDEGAASEQDEYV